MELILERVGDRAVKDGLAGDAVDTDRRIEGRVVGRIEHMAVNAGDRNEVVIALEACGHGPQHVAHVKDVHIRVNKEHMLHL